MTLRTHICALLACLVYTLPRLYSQTSSAASLQGTVTDASGALIPNATIRIQPIGNEASLTGSTGADGSFTFSGLVPDTYIVSAEQLGFNKVYKTVTLTPGQTGNIALVLNLNVVNQNVTVTARSSTVIEAPTAQTIESVGYQETKDSADFTIQESLNLVPGITTITGNGPRDISISLRGSNARQDYGIRNAILFDDGFQVTQPDGLGRADLVDPHAYGSIDAVEGPSSTLYGNDAIEGAIFFHTRPGAEIRGIDFGTDAGPYGYINNYASIGNAGASYDYSVFLSNTRGKQSYIPNFEFNSATANILTTFSLTQRDRVLFKFINNDTDTALPVRLSVAEFRANPFQRGCVGLTLTNNTAATNPHDCSTDHVYINGFAGPEVYVTPDVAQNGRHDRRTVVGARWEHDFAGNTTLRAQGVWDDKDIDQPTGATAARGSTPSFIFNSDVTRTGLLRGHHSTTYGGAFLKYEDTNSNGYNLTGTGAQGAYTSGDFGTILGTGFNFREELSLGGRITIIGGFSYEHTALADGETLYSYSATAAPTTKQFNADHVYNDYAPAVSILVRASNSLSFHSRLGTGYALPVNSAFFTTPAGVYGDNTSLKPATNVGIDFGANWLVARYITLDAAGYYERYANENIAESPGAGLLSYTFNVPSSAHRGLVSAIDWHPSPSRVSGLHLRVAYTLDDQIYRKFIETLNAAASGPYPAVTASFDRGGIRIPGLIPNNLSARLAYDNTASGKGDFGFYMETNYRGSLWLDNADQLSAPSATVMNFDIHYDPSPGRGFWSRTHFYFDILNLANRTIVGSTNNTPDVLDNVAGVGVERTGATLDTSATGLLYVGAPRLSIGGFRIHF